MRDYDSEIRQGMHVDWDVPVDMDDGTTLRCDVFRPSDSGRWPVILSYGPYGKGLHFEDGFPLPWSLVTTGNPHFGEGSSNRFQCFELVDPERFVPDGYAVVRFDSRGAGRSPGYLDPWSARETRDMYQAIEWCAAQSWSNGKIGLSGTSYLAMNQWQVAALRPPHLAAICVWEGASDIYRDMVRHGGILSTFGEVWYQAGVIPVQHGRGSRGNRSRMTGAWVSGPETLSDETLQANRIDWHAECLSHSLASDEFWTSRQADLSRIEVPVLSTANWGGQGLHLRGAIEGFATIGSTHKWLDIHCHNHWFEYYTPYGINLQRRFFGHFLKGESTGWDEQPPVHIQVRRPGERYTWRNETEWPLQDTRWTKFYLDPADLSLRDTPVKRAASVSYRGLSDGVTFMTPPLAEATEITGPVAARLVVSSAGEDADLFLVLRVFGPDLAEVTFPGHVDPHTPIAQGWLRASHRKLDAERSKPFRPYHTHDQIQPLVPGERYAIDVEILPTCIVVPPGYRIALTIRGKDYVYSGLTRSREPRGFTGVGQFRHNDGRDRPPAVFDADVTLHTGPDDTAWLMLPVIPKRSGH